MRILIIIGMGMMLGACAQLYGGDRDTFPSLSDMPEPPEATLTPERREALTEELEDARDAKG